MFLRTASCKATNVCPKIQNQPCSFAWKFWQIPAGGIDNALSLKTYFSLTPSLGLYWVRYQSCPRTVPSYPNESPSCPSVMTSPTHFIIRHLDGGCFLVSQAPASFRCAAFESCLFVAAVLLRGEIQEDTPRGVRRLLFPGIGL